MLRSSVRHVALAMLAVILVLASGVVAGSVPSSATTSGPLIHVHPFARHAGTASSNWSGYGVAGAFNAISGSWTVPTAAPSSTPTYSSTWIGIDGLANRNLIQTGTESDVINGVVTYTAWWEVLPAAEIVIRSLPVHPGDHMSASITHGAGRTWTITLIDTTTGHSFTHTRKYKGIGASAEWIQERPRVGQTLSSLTNYGSTTFTGLTTNGGNPHLTSMSAISMLNDAGTAVISTPSSPSALGDAFSVAYGPIAPSPPTG